MIEVIKTLIDFLNSQNGLVILVIFLLVLIIISVLGNIGIDLVNKKITFGRQKNKRSCGDCVSLLLAKRTAFDTLYYNKQNSILRQQMIFAEHKLLEMELLVGYEFRCNIRDEIRRSCKSNGFAERTLLEYDKYVQNQIDTLITMIGMTHRDFPTIIKEIYDNAKTISLRVDAELKKLEEDFIKDIDTLVGA